MARRRCPRSLRFPDSVQLIECRTLDRLLPAGGPLYFQTIDKSARAQAEMKAPLILGAEPAAAIHVLNLNLRVPMQRDPRPDGAAIAHCAFELHVDPVAAWLDRVPVDEQRPALVRNNDVENTTVRQVRER